MSHNVQMFGPLLMFYYLQNHKVVEGERDLKRSSVSTVWLKERYLEPFAQTA